MHLHQLLAIFCMVFFLLPASMISQDLSAYEKKQFVTSAGDLPYRILLPKDYKKSKSYPLILFLHGSGERGNDNEQQLTHGAQLFLKKDIREDYPAIVVFPQCPEELSWNNTKYVPTDDGYAVIYPKTIEYNAQQNLLEGLIEYLKSSYPIDEKRLYVGGLSMGSMGTLELVRRNPTMFAAAIAICGAADPMAAAALEKTPLSIFHGGADTVIPASGSEALYKALKPFNADVRFTIYHGVGHDSWTNAFNEPDLLVWLFSKSR